MDHTDHYDMVIVGSGVGLTILDAALQHGRTCAIIENAKFGGTCLTRGCVPSKILAYPADVIRETAKAGKIGLDYRLESLDWAAVSRRMWHYIDESKQIEASLTDVKNLTVYRGLVEFTGPQTMQVPDEAGGRIQPFQADQFVLAPGARTNVPPVAGLADSGYLTSETFFGAQFPEKPWKSLIIVGGGAIGAEFAHIFSAFGAQVTVIEMMPHLVPTEEEAISTQLEDNFRLQGINVLTGCQVVSVEPIDGGKLVSVRDGASGATRTLFGEAVFIASGSRSNADLLKVGKAGIATDARGYIITNEFLETSQKNIWALGDVNGKYQFRHKANHEADVLVHNLFRPDQSRQAAQYTSVPWAIFTWPQIAHVGLREQEVKERGVKYLVGINHYSAVAKGYAMGYDAGEPDDGFVKLIVDENMKILGAHIIGPQAAILVQSFVYLMNAGFRCQPPIRRKRKWAAAERHIFNPFPSCPEAGTFDPITRSMVIHPSLSELTAWVVGNLEWAD